MSIRSRVVRLNSARARIVRGMGSTTLRNTLLRFSLVSAFVKVIGFSRSAAIAALVGAGANLDAYFATQIIVGIAAVTFAEQFEMMVGQKVRWAADTSGPEGVHQTASRLFGFSLALGGLCGLAYIVAYPLLYRWLANPAAQLPTSDYLKLGLTFLPFVATYVPYRTICALLKGAGYYNVSFQLDAAQAVIFFLLTIAFLKISSDAPGAAVLAVSAAQVVSQFLLLAVGVHAVHTRLKGVGGWRPRLEGVREFLAETSALYLFGLLFLGFTALDRHFAAVSMIGGLSLLSFAATASATVRSVLSFEQVFGIEFGTAGSRQEILTRAVRTSLRVGIPAAVIQAVFAHDLMRVAFQRGRFSAADSDGAAGVLVAYGIATIVLLLWPIALRMLQAVGGLSSAFTLLPAGLLAALVTGLVLVPRIGLPGAVAATGVGHVILVGSAFVVLKRRGLQAISGSDAFAVLVRTVALAAIAIGIRSAVVGPHFLLLRLGAAVLIVLLADFLLVSVLNSRLALPRVLHGSSGS